MRINKLCNKHAMIHFLLLFFEQNFLYNIPIPHKWFSNIFQM